MPPADPAVAGAGAGPTKAWAIRTTNATTKQQHCSPKRPQRTEPQQVKGKTPLTTKSDTNCDLVVTSARIVSFPCR